MAFDPDSMTRVGTSREFMSLRDCQQTWYLTFLQTRSDKKISNLRADSQINKLRTKSQICKRTPDMEKINNISVSGLPKHSHRKTFILINLRTFKT